jgi:predicted ArsR family transcriptional regulator
MNEVRGTAPTGPPLEALPPTRRAILMAIKRHGPSSSQELARQLGVTSTAVRQQLAQLAEDGLVRYRADPDGRGRPEHRYALTEAAESLFPKRYGELTNELLGYLGGPDSEAVKTLFEARRQRRVAAARARVEGMALGEQVHELARILDEDGYLADVAEHDGGWLVSEHNCAILSVATGFRRACSSELSFLRDVLDGATVERVTHMMEGAHACAYLIRPAPGPQPLRRRAR